MPRAGRESGQWVPGEGGAWRGHPGTERGLTGLGMAFPPGRWLALCCTAGLGQSARKNSLSLSNQPLPGPQQSRGTGVWGLLLPWGRTSCFPLAASSIHLTSTGCGSGVLPGWLRAGSPRPPSSGGSMLGESPGPTSPHHLLHSLHGPQWDLAAPSQGLCSYCALHSPLTITGHCWNGPHEKHYPPLGTHPISWSVLKSIAPD